MNVESINACRSMPACRKSLEPSKPTMTRIRPLASWKQTREALKTRLVGACYE
jgi:hypothetical protein